MACLLGFAGPPPEGMSRWAVEARRRLEDAEEDVRVARLLEGAGHYACFHYQQAAEKAVEAATSSPRASGPALRCQPGCP